MGELRSREGSDAGEIRRELPGRLTTQMLALAPSEEGLRIAIAVSGRIVDERVIRKGRVSVADGSIEERFHRSALVRFTRSRGAWSVRFGDGARGKLALGEFPAGHQIVELERVGARMFRLASGARGRIATSEGAILFQIVALPPRAPRPTLPLAVRTRAIDLDWSTTVLGAFSFLLHFLALGMLYSDWTDPVMDSEATVSGVVDSIRTLPLPPKVETASTNAVEAVKAPTDPIGKKTPTAGTTRPNPSVASGAAALKADLDRIEMSTIAALGGRGPATSDVLRKSEIPTTVLDQAAARSSGVSSGGPRVTSAGPIRPGSEFSLADLGQRTLTQSTRVAEAANIPKGPIIQSIVLPPTGNGNVRDAARVVAGMRPTFHACYQRAINDYPDAEGSVRLSLDVGANGEVQSVSASSSGNIPASLVSCVRTRAQQATFSAPEGGRAWVVVPITFKKQ